MKRAFVALSLLLALALHADTGGKEKKIAIFQGKPDAESLTAGEPFPLLDGRPKELRPWALPKGIRYKFAEDDAVLAAAGSLTQHLLSGKKPETPLFSDSAFVQPGAWKLLKSRLTPLKSTGPAITNLVPLGPNKVLKLEANLLQSQEDLGKLEQILTEILKREGGGQVRALQTAEMRKWWMFIAFDITEPTLVLETKKGTLFIFEFGKDGRVSAVDELTHLPN